MLPGAIGVAARPKGCCHLTRNASLTSSSARIDQSLGSHGTLFGRFVESPSASHSAGIAAVHRRDFVLA